jgi:hypothetical protein
VAIGNNPSVDAALARIVPAVLENGLTVIVFGTVAFSIVVSILFLVTRGPAGSAYDQIGAGGISRESDYSGADASAMGDSQADRDEQETEIRQMLEARSERLQRRGEPALDVDAEMARLLAELDAPKDRDPGLIVEVRQMVVARNERRRRQGLEPLDVDSEIARTLAELDP